MLLPHFLDDVSRRVQSTDPGCWTYVVLYPAKPHVCPQGVFKPKVITNSPCSSAQISLSQWGLTTVHSHALPPLLFLVFTTLLSVHWTMWWSSILHLLLLSSPTPLAEPPQRQGPVCYCPDVYSSVWFTGRIQTFVEWMNKNRKPFLWLQWGFHELIISSARSPPADDGDFVIAKFHFQIAHFPVMLPLNSNAS